MSMGETACTNCQGACCKGAPLLIMQLSAEELDFMQAGGNTFYTIADPSEYDREDVIYPAGLRIHPDKGTFSWLAEKGREFEPLPAGFGRYALKGACKYLARSLLGFDVCTVYDDRPQACRDLEVGSDKCLLLRQIHSVPLPFPVQRQKPE